MRPVFGACRAFGRGRAFGKEVKGRVQLGGERAPFPLPEPVAAGNRIATADTKSVAF